MTTEQNLHPSYLELDRAGLGCGSRGTLEHLKWCVRCADHVRRVQSPLPIPGWLPEGARSPARPVWLGRLAWLGAAAAAVAVSVWISPRVTGLREDRTTVKAAYPTIAVYVKRGERVMLWSGDVPLEAGDRIQLQVAPEGYRHIQVTTRNSNGENQVLFEGDMNPTRIGFLPVSFGLDTAQNLEPLEITMMSAEGHIWTKRIRLGQGAGFQEVKP